MIKTDFSVEGDSLKMFQQMTRDNSASNPTFLYVAWMAKQDYISKTKQNTPGKQPRPNKHPPKPKTYKETRHEIHI